MHHRSAPNTCIKKEKLLSYNTNASQPDPRLLQLTPSNLAIPNEATTTTKKQIDAGII